jgi:hypothetical protein
MARQARSDTLQRWRRFIDSLAEGRGGIPELEQHRIRLQEMYERAFRLDQERAALEAAKQAATREFNDILESGQKLASMMRSLLRVRHRSEKLVEFDVKPYYGRPRKKSSRQG